MARISIFFFLSSLAYFERLFNRLPNHILTFDHKSQIANVSVEQCARRCVLELTFRCLGFDYELNSRKCWLTDLSPSGSHGLIPQANVDYYERQSSAFATYTFFRADILQVFATNIKRKLR